MRIVLKVSSNNESPWEDHASAGKEVEGTRVTLEGMLDEL
jgi:hypothetical protein